MDFDDFLMWFCGLLVAAAVVLMAWMFWVFWTDSQSHTFELKRGDWTCSKSESQSSLLPMVVGKVTVMVPTASNVCVEYRRNAG